jgi:dTDP-4-amino-4,6-dideoxygalactose transaminase
MDPIIDLAKENDIFIVEDCAQAHGARYNNQPVGSIGDIGCWSFCQDKIMTTGGEGGMVTTNNRLLWKKMWSYKDHGKSWDAVYGENHSKGFRWLHESFGTNFRMTEMQAAIGRVQLTLMDQWHLKRKENSNLIWSAAKKSPLFRVPDIPKNISHAAYKCYIFVDGSEVDRDNILKIFIDNDVPCFSGSCSEVYLEKAFNNTGLRPKKRLPHAKKLGETSLAFLCHPTLSQSDIEHTCEIINSISRLYRI